MAPEVVRVERILAAGAAGILVPRLASETDTLRILAAAFPLLTVNAVELHVRSGRGRNREVLAVNSITLAINLPLSIGLISAFGLPGAAAALALFAGGSIVAAAILGLDVGGCRTFVAARLRPPPSPAVGRRNG